MDTLKSDTVDVSWGDTLYEANSVAGCRGMRCDLGLCSFTARASYIMLRELKAVWVSLGKQLGETARMQKNRHLCFLCDNQTFV